MYRKANETSQRLSPLSDMVEKNVTGVSIHLTSSYQNTPHQFISTMPVAGIWSMAAADIIINFIPKLAYSMVSQIIYACLLTR